MSGRRNTWQEQIRSVNVGAPDTLPACPRCHDLSSPNAERCETCGARLTENAS